VIGLTQYFAAKGTDGRQLMFWLITLTFLIHIFKTICDNLISKSEI